MVRGVSLDGMASGMETDQIIKEIMEIERISIHRLEAEKEEAEVEQEQWQEINQMLQGFDSSLNALRDRSTFESRDVNSSREELMTATAETGANEGNYQMQVKQLATAHRVGGARLSEIADDEADANTELGLSGKFELSGAEIEVSSGDSLRDIRDSINSADSDAQASIMDNRLILTSAETGEENEVSLSNIEGNALDELGFLEESTAQLSTELGDLSTLDSADDQFTIKYTDGSGDLKEVVDFEDANITSGEDLASHINTEIEEDIAFFDTETGELTLSSLNTGEEAEVSITGMEEDVESVFQDLSAGDSVSEGFDFTNQLTEAENALFEVDGLEVERATNEGLDDVIEGVSLDLHGASEGEVFNLSVNNDAERTKEAISNFVNEYNTVQSYLHQLTQEDGLLQGDTTARRLSTNLRRQVTNRIRVDEDYDQLSQLGIEIDPDADPGDINPGNMQIDESKLDEVLSEDPEVVKKMFRAREDSDGVDGIARRVRDRVQEYIRSGDGVLTRRDSSLSSQMDRIDRRIEDQERRMERREETMRRQFTRMETAMNDAQAQQSWLAGQIDSLG